MACFNLLSKDFLGYSSSDTFFLALNRSRRRNANPRMKHSTNDTSNHEKLRVSYTTSMN